MTSIELAQTEELHKKVIKLSKNNQKLLQSLSSHLILQSSYLDKYLKSSRQNECPNLQEKYENLLKLSSESMERNEFLLNQLQQKRKQIETIKHQIEKDEMESIRIDHEMTQSERKIMQEEELEKQYQFELMKKNAELKQELIKFEELQNSLIEQNALYEKENIQLHTALENVSQQLKQTEFVLNKKQQQEISLITELEDLKRQMLRKKEKLLKSYNFHSQPKQKSSKTQIVREIDQIQSLISNYKQKQRAKNKA